VFVPSLLVAYYGPDLSSQREALTSLEEQDCCSGVVLVVVLCNAEPKLFLVIYQVHCFNTISSQKDLDW
jgi:hypothetical protein